MKAVVDLGDEEGNFGKVGRSCNFDFHPQLLAGKFFEGRGFFRNFSGRAPLDALEENIRLQILMLIGVMNVTTAQEDPTGNS
jgi:hypothetical protein